MFDKYNKHLFFVFFSLHSIKTPNKIFKMKTFECGFVSNNSNGKT